MKFLASRSEIQDRLRRGARVPSWVDEEPPLHDGDAAYLAGFRKLCSERSYVGAFAAPAPLARSLIRDLGRTEYGLEGDMLDVFEYVVRALDSEWLKLNQAERERDNPSAK